MRGFYKLPMLRFSGHLLAIVTLTLLTQLGGVAWLIAIAFRLRWAVFVAVLVISYAGLSLAAIWAAPIFGRTALSCFENGPLQVQNPLYCALNRNYVTPQMHAVLDDTARAMDRQFPGTQTLVLDANFPFFDGFPLLPHRSHDDGKKADLAFYYQLDGRYLPGAVRAPMGYFAFEQGPTDCPPKLLTLRWDLNFVQNWWRDITPEPRRNISLINMLASDGRVGKIFVEPHLVDDWGVTHSKVRFQGCRAARHDDHIHLQLQ